LQKFPIVLVQSQHEESVDMNSNDSQGRPKVPVEGPSRAEPSGNGKRPGQVPRPFMTSFLEHLVRNRIITEEVAHEAADWKQIHEMDRRSLTEILKEEFGLSPDVLHHQIAQFYAFRVLDINERGARRLLPLEIVKLFRGLPEPVRQMAIRHNVLPWDIAENQ
jgi:hypothetical protein